MDVEALIAALPPEIEGYEDTEDPEVRGGGWHITTVQSADWALLRLAECEAEAEEIDRQAEAAIRRVRERADALKAKAARGSSYFRFKLAEYAATHRSEIVRGKVKSREYVHGKIAFRKKGGRLVVRDAAELEGWLLAQPVEAGLYRMKIEAEKRALNDLFKTTGEVPPGCDVEPESEEVTIEAQAPEGAIVKGA